MIKLATISLVVLFFWGCLVAIPVNIAIMEADSTEYDPVLQAVVYNETASVLNESGLFRLIDRKHLEQVMREQKIILEQAVHAADYAQLGNLLQADYFIFPSIYRVDSSILVYFNVTDVSRGEILLSRSMQVVDDFQILKREIRRILMDVISYFQIEIKVIEVNYPQILIDPGKSDPQQKYYDVFRRIPGVSGVEVIRYSEFKVGKVLIADRLSEHVYSGRIMEGEDIAVGDFLVEATIAIKREPTSIADTDKKLLQAGHLLIISQPEDAVIYIDNLPRKQIFLDGILSYELQAGLHQLRLERKGFHTLCRDILITQGQNQKFRIVLQPESGQYYISSEPAGAEVFIDGQYEGLTPVQVRRKRGRHSLEIRKAGFINQNRRLAFSDKKERGGHFVLQKQSEITEDTPDNMVRISGGTFEMGSTGLSAAMDERPRHQVTLQSFFIDKYEVMVKEYRQYCEVTGTPMPGLPSWLGDNHPMVNVSWEEASKYAHWCGKRLPTEAEWEFAAQGLNLVGNFIGLQYEDEWDRTAPVGSFHANGKGVFDMFGNVFEWCSDWYDRRYYSYSLLENPVGADYGNRKVIRGGCWALKKNFSQKTDRNMQGAKIRSTIVGFRCATDVVEWKRRDEEEKIGIK
ncbi:MAG: SUMF1/EgtB/PvdO family nonheme iron enzyme [Candidatus Cloacimonetes bacterium]|nr:SUMF1/EgtB/PvdO family nonheme iron enzyme [Candidatus Cloacimonadota bacterium]